MPIFKAFVFRCPECGETAVFFSSDYPSAMKLSEATEHAREQGWVRNYGADWFCPACWEKHMAVAVPAGLAKQRKAAAHDGAVNITNSTLPAGWARPATAQRHHFFPEGEARSLCGRWRYADAEARDDQWDDHKGNCGACKRLVSVYRQQHGEALKTGALAPATKADAGSEVVPA